MNLQVHTGISLHTSSESWSAASGAFITDGDSPVCLLHMWPTFPFGGSQNLSTCSSTIGSEFLNDESSLLTPVLLFSKLKLQHVVQQREI